MCATGGSASQRITDGGVYTGNVRCTQTKYKFLTSNQAPEVIGRGGSTLAYINKIPYATNLFNTYLAKLTHGVKLVVRAGQLKVLHRGHRHPSVKVEAVVALGEGGLFGVERKHTTMMTLFDVIQLYISR